MLINQISIIKDRDVIWKLMLDQSRNKTEWCASDWKMGEICGKKTRHYWYSLQVQDRVGIV